MAATPDELRLADLKQRYEQQSASQRFTRLYDDAEYGHAFAVIHDQLNTHFVAINGRAETTGHYWADNSRALIDLTKQVEQDLYDLNRLGVEAHLDPRYQAALDRCGQWLSRSGGSAVPDDFEPIDIIEYEPAVTQDSKALQLKKSEAKVDLKMVGEGSFANVYSYVDPDYGIRFAVKRAKRTISDRDLERFRREFEVMKELSFPYVVQVYRYDDAKNEYRMEFCDENLRTYIATRNNTIKFSHRKRIALQLLYGLNYIHSVHLLHRDVSLQNVLMKVYSSGAVLVKLSDFGLVKAGNSDFTRTKTEMKGTIRDPQLGSFADYQLAHEIYAVGFVLAYIFTGRESLPSPDSVLGGIIAKCVDANTAQRYDGVLQLIDAVESLEAHVEDAPA